MREDAATADAMPLRAFWKAVEDILARATAEELRATVRAMASKVTRSGRRQFVEALGERLEAEQVGVQDLDRLLLEVRELASAVQEALEHLEPPHDEPWYGDYSGDEEDGLGPLEAFLEPLGDLFDRAGVTFDDGQIALARSVYDELFAILEMENELGIGITPHHLTGFDLAASRARYLRAVYEDTPAPERVETLYAELQRYGVHDEQSWPTLEEIINVSARPLPDLPAFLDEWIAYLREEGAGADTWLREAIRLSRGVRGLEELARTEGAAHPRVFIDWCAALAAADDHRGVIAAAKVGFDTLPEGAPIRAKVADYLDTAAAALGQAKKQQLARWEALLARPSLARLLALRDTATSRAGRTRLMRDASQRLEAVSKQRARDRRQAYASYRDDISPRLVSDAVLAHGYLLATSWEAARALASRGPVLEWYGDSPRGLVVACFLVGLSGKPRESLPVHLAELWTSRLQAKCDIPDRVLDAYREPLAALWSQRDQLSDYAAWSLKSAKKRIHAIVSGQHRRSYGDAARLLMACCEHLQARGEMQQAARLLADVRSRFPRHRAFQTEVERALSRADGLAR